MVARKIGGQAKKDYYLAAMRKQNELQIKQLISEGDGGKEKEIRRQFEAVTAQAEQFLLAQDFEPTDRKRISRIRVGVLFIESYRELPLLAWPRLLLDTLVELEEQFIAFRFRHARMVERTIGRRVGTGGSPGVDYLDTTARYRIFKELWAVRTLLLPMDLLPKLEKARYSVFHPTALSLDNNRSGSFILRPLFFLFRVWKRKQKIKKGQAKIWNVYSSFAFLQKAKIFEFFYFNSLPLLNPL